MNIQYVYLLKEREFIKTKEEIYTIGRTEQINLQRFKQYPKNSMLLLQVTCTDCKNFEKMIIKLFKKKYNQRRDIGIEYFEGNFKEMIKDIMVMSIQDIDDITIGTDIKNEDNIDLRIGINNYKDFKKYNVDCDIIITNKKRTNGYIKYNKSEGYQVIDTEFFLRKYIEENAIDSIKCNGNRQWIDYDNDKLIIDIKNKCYNKNIVEYKLRYYECVIKNMDNELKIFNMNDNKYYDISREYLTSKINYYSININEINHDIVNLLLEVYTNKNVLNNFRKLFYNILVQPSKETVIVYDYYDDRDGYHLSDWIVYCLNILGIKEYYTSYEYSIKRKDNKFIDLKPRLIIVEIDGINIDGILEDLKKDKIKHIIVRQHNKNDNYYNSAALNKYVSKKLTHLLSNLDKKQSYNLYDYLKDVDLKNKNTIRQLFQDPQYLFSNMLQWSINIKNQIE